MNIKLIGSRFMSVLMACLASLTAIALFSQSPALADIEQGAAIFKTNCASCHAGGRNLVKAEKNLKLASLEKYGMNSVEAIIAQVTNGKNAMPAFRGRLKPAQIESVAEYVLAQAQKDWKK
jgi:cytochrome c6